MLHGCPPSPDAWGRLNVVTPFHHLSGDSHINSSLREGPLRHLARRRAAAVATRDGDAGTPRAPAGAWPPRAALVYDRAVPLTHARAAHGTFRSDYKELRSCSTSSRRLHPRFHSMRIAWIV